VCLECNHLCIVVCSEVICGYGLIFLLVCYLACVVMCCVVIFKSVRYVIGVCVVCYVWAA